MRTNEPSQPISPEGPSLPREGQMEHPSSSLTPVPEETSKKQRKHSLRAGLAVVAGRTVGALSRRLHIGGGTSIVGVVAQRIYPDIVEHLATELQFGSVMVTGTNGKTTTSSFISAILRDDGLRVWRNREGSNLMRGIASSLVIRAEPNGHLRRAGKAISILEVDEAAFPQLVQSIPPRIAVFTNLFRDQLDRYGEVNSISARWKTTIAQLSPETILILNADDPSIAQLGENFTGKVIYYGINDLSLDSLSSPNTDTYQAIDSRTCPKCGSDYIYDVRFYSHMGHYHCSHCDYKRPQVDVRATHVRSESFDRLRVTVSAYGQEQDIIVPLPGIYNVYNALAAITATLALNSSWEPITTGIEQSKPVFGRGERVQAEGRTIRLLLAKNPTGFNEVLRTLFTDTTPRSVFFILNDNIADGQDISWIWDVDFERLVDKTQNLVISGTRALDLALRMKYAGVPADKITLIPSEQLRTLKKLHKRARVSRSRKQDTQQESAQGTMEKLAVHEPRLYGLKNALDMALQQTPVGETLFVVPTYTGLLEVHGELEARGLTPHYWEGRNT